MGQRVSFSLRFLTLLVPTYHTQRPTEGSGKYCVAVEGRHAHCSANNQGAPESQCCASSSNARGHASTWNPSQAFAPISQPNLQAGPVLAGQEVHSVSSLAWLPGLPCVHPGT